MAHEKLEALIRRIRSKKKPVTGMNIQYAKCVQVTIAELKDAIDANSTHPVAEVYAEAIMNRKDHEKVVVDQEDILALCENKDVKVEFTIDDEGHTIVKKTAVDKPSTSKPTTPKPAEATKKPTAQR